MNDDEAIIVREALALLDHDAGAIARVETLQGGSSGSMVFRLWTTTAQFVLKVTLPGSADFIQQRAVREINFYRSLAPVLPVITPQIVASTTHSSGTTVLLQTAYQPSPNAVRWQRAHYIAVAEQLAAFHSRYWNRTGTLALGWLRSGERFDAPDLAAIRTAWTPLRTRLDALGTTRTEVDAMLAQGARYLLLVAQRLQTFPTTLCHGDFHIDNLLHDAEGRLVWADWQEVGIGYGPSDLSFFVQRAMTDGGDVPEDDMLAVYHARLCAAVGNTTSLEAIRQVMDAFELGTRLLHWPHYLAAADDATIATHMARIDQIMSRSDHQTG